MKTSLFIFLCLFFIQTASAETFDSEVVEVVSGEIGEPALVKWANGRVSFFSSEDAMTFKLLNELPSHHSVKVKINEASKMIALQSLEIQNTIEPDVENSPMMSYTPTIIQTEEEARQLLLGFRRVSPFQFSIQCYNLAHMRAYEGFKYHGVKSMKMFLFFTDRYIRNYGFKWWFHVAPMVMVKYGDKVEQRMVDKEWMKKPTATKEWTDKFVYSHKECPQISKYSQYTQGQETNDCYLLPVNMYYWQPSSLEELERTRIERTQFDMSEVNTAFARDA